MITGDPPVTEVEQALGGGETAAPVCVVTHRRTGCSGSQTGYAMALGVGLVTDPALVAKVGEKFVAKLAPTGYHLRTGFIGSTVYAPPTRLCRSPIRDHVYRRRIENRIRHRNGAASSMGV